MKRILIVNVNWRGDVLFSTPFIQALREHFPDSFIACLIVPRCEPILKDNPHLDELIVFDECKTHKGLWGKLRLIKSLRAKHFDLAFLLHRSCTRTLFCYLAAIPERVGYYTRKRALLLTKSIPVPTKQLHKVEYFLNIARSYGINSGRRNYQFFIPQADFTYIDSLLHKYGLTESDFLVVINPGGNWQLKRWPKENFAQLADQLISQYQAKIIFSGANKDLPLTQQITSLMKQTPVNLSGQTSLSQLGALMNRAVLVISNDSGPMHIAASQGTKVICLFGPTSAEITGPYGEGGYTVIQKDVRCQRPCYNLECKDNRCMRAITVEDVLNSVEKTR